MTAGKNREGGSKRVREMNMIREEEKFIKKEEQDLEILYENLEMEKIHKLESASIIESIQKFIYDTENDLKRIESQLEYMQKNPDRERILHLYEELRLKHNSFKVVLKRLEKIEHNDEKFEKNLNKFIRRITEDFDTAARLLKKIGQ